MLSCHLSRSTRCLQAGVCRSQAAPNQGSPKMAVTRCLRSGTKLNCPKQSLSNPTQERYCETKQIQLRINGSVPNGMRGVGKAKCHFLTTFRRKHFLAATLRLTTTDQDEAQDARRIAGFLCMRSLASCAIGRTSRSRTYQDRSPTRFVDSRLDRPACRYFVSDCSHPVQR